MLIDMHCHIAPGVDDGPQDIDQTRAMLSAARRVDVTHIVATPHLQMHGVDYAPAFDALIAAADEQNIQILRGYEVAIGTLMTMPARQRRKYVIEGTNNILIELPYALQPPRLIDWLTDFSKEFYVIIAHPERCAYVQKDLIMARRMCDAGCALQLTAYALIHPQIGAITHTAQALLKAGLVSYIASDAHAPKDYESFARAREKYAAVWPN